MNIILFTNTAHVTGYVFGCRHPLLYKDLLSLIPLLKPRGVFFVVGLCRTVVQILILFQTKKSHFPHPSSDLPEAEIILLRLERQQKRFLKIHFEFAYCSFLLIHFGIETTNTFINSPIPPKPYPIPDQSKQYLNYRKIPKISPGAYIFQRPILRAYISRGLSREGNLRFKIDWASLIVGRKCTVFALFYFVFEGNFQVPDPRRAYIWRGLFSEFYGIPVRGGKYP